jgi:hypothetical protein
MQLTQESEKLLWKADLDKIGLDLLGISGVESDWFYTVVCDDGAFFTGDPVFCFPREASEDFDKHFADVAKRHDLSLQSGFLTKQTVEDLVLGHGARNAHPLESYVRKEENGP